MVPESSKDKSQNREVQRSLFSGSDFDDARLPRPPEEPSSSRNGKPSDEPHARRGLRRGSAGQSFLPFDRTMPSARAPAGDEGTQADTPASHAPTEPLRLPAVPPEPVASGEVAKARELIHAVSVLKRVEGDGRPP